MVGFASIGAELRLETFQITENLLVHDAHESVKFLKRILQGCGRKQHFGSMRDSALDRVGNAIRWLIDIPKPVRFIHDDQIPVQRIEVRLLGSGKVIGTNHESLLVEGIEIP